MIAFLMAVTAYQHAPVGSALWKERLHPPMPSIPACTLPGQARVAASLSELPAGVLAEIRRFFGPDHGLADADGEFNATDFIEDDSLPRRRFLRAYQTGDNWILWYERGPLAPVTLEIAPSRQPNAPPGAYEARPGTSMSSTSAFVNLCAASRAILEGVRSDRP